MDTPEIGQEYTSTVPFEIDEETETLGDHDPTAITVPDQQILLQRARSSRVSLEVLTLAHGTFKSQPASLVGLRFRFSYPPDSSSRFTLAELNISFHPSSEDSSEFPPIRQFAPKSIRADVTPGSVVQSTGFGITISAGEGISPVSAGVSADRSNEVSFVREFRCDVIGEPWTSDEAYDQGCEIDNSVTWYVKEHKLFKEGIPRELRVVVVVGRRQKAVLAKVKAKVKTSWGLSMLGSLFTQARPLLIGENATFGNSPPAEDFAALSTEQLNAFVGLDSPSVA